jgi:hypothetical protein
MSVDTGLVQKRWQDNKLYMESLLEDPLLNSEGLTKTIEVTSGKNRVSMPKNQFFIDCTPKDKKGRAARNIELVFLKSLDVDPIEGNASSLIGNEDTLELKYTTAYANDWAAGVTEDTFGIDFRELQLAYGLNNEIRPLLGKWLGELRGYYARQAMIQKVSNNLTAAPVSLTAGLNPNWYFLNDSEADQPGLTNYGTLATFENEVGTLIAAQEGSTLRFTVPYILTMLRYIKETKYIEPAQIEGMNAYLGLLSSPEFDHLRDPSQDNSWGRYWRDVGSTENLNMIVPGAKIVIAEEFVACKDPRYATLALTGNASDYTFTFGYLKYGRKTTRTSSTGNGYLNMNIICGAGCLLKYEPEAPHYENQPDDYNKKKGNGLFGAVGYALPIWDLDSADQTGTSAQQESVMLVPTSRV